MSLDDVHRFLRGAIAFVLGLCLGSWAVVSHAETIPAIQTTVYKCGHGSPYSTPALACAHDCATHGGVQSAAVGQDNCVCSDGAKGNIFASSNYICPADAVGPQSEGGSMVCIVSACADGAARDPATGNCISQNPCISGTVSTATMSVGYATGTGWTSGQTNPTALCDGQCVIHPESVVTCYATPAPPWPAAAYCTHSGPMTGAQCSNSQTQAQNTPGPIPTTYNPVNPGDPCADGYNKVSLTGSTTCQSGPCPAGTTFGTINGQNTCLPTTDPGTGTGTGTGSGSGSGTGDGTGDGTGTGDGGTGTTDPNDPGTGTGGGGGGAGTGGTGTGDGCQEGQIKDAAGNCVVDDGTGSGGGTSTDGDPAADGDGIDALTAIVNDIKSLLTGKVATKEKGTFQSNAAEVDQLKQDLNARVMAIKAEASAMFGTVSMDAGSLPCDSITVLGQQFSLCVAKYEAQLSVIGLAVLAAATLGAAFIIFRS